MIECSCRNFPRKRKEKKKKKKRVGRSTNLAIYIRSMMNTLGENMYNVFASVFKFTSFYLFNEKVIKVFSPYIIIEILVLLSLK
jgi:hypothetical protein